MTLPITPSFRLEGRRAIVTGAGRGIGAGLANALAMAGAAVTLASRTLAEVEAVSQEIAAAGGRAVAVSLDVLDLAAVETFFAASEAFDILVNNAGCNRPRSMLDVSIVDYDAVLDLNLKSAFFVSQACARKMIHEGIAGSLIHVGSQMGHVGGANRALYCASKWGMEGMSKAFALDLASHGIRSNTIAPTFVDTPMTRPFFEDQSFLDSVLDKIKLGRLGRVEDLMGSVVFLASDASALITGTSIVIDGGWTAD